MAYIGSRALAEVLDASVRIIGVEPSEGMRRQAEEGTEAPNVSYRAGRAEALPIADKSASAVVAAQALQWFNRPQFYAEAKPALVPAGVLAVAQQSGLAVLAVLRSVRGVVGGAQPWLFALLSVVRHRG